MIDLLTSQSEVPIGGLFFIMVLMFVAGYILARALHDD